MNVGDIKSADWSLAVGAIGNVVEGIDDINQCIITLLSTQKGSDPFRPDFGSDVWDWIDRPLNIAVPNMKRAIFEAVALWEQRVIVTRVDHVFQNETGRQEPIFSGAKFNIGWKLKRTQTTGSVEVTLGLYDALVKKAQQSPSVISVNYLTTELSDPILTETEKNIIV